jgi:hypothetical protein
MQFPEMLPPDKIQRKTEKVGGKPQEKTPMSV